MIRVTDVHISYQWHRNRIEAVRGVSLDINEGDYVAIVGPSGSGKSTLMAALAGLVFPQRGDIFLKSDNINKLSRRKRAMVRAISYGIIFQFSEMIGRYTIEENLQLSWQSRFNQATEGYTDRLEYLCEALQMHELIKFRPSKLSGGQMQKAAIANALIKDPPVILADEPSGDLDPESQKLLKLLFREEHKRGKTIVLITHDMKLAFDAKTIFELRDGQISEVLK